MKNPLGLLRRQDGFCQPRWCLLFSINSNKRQNRDVDPSICCISSYKKEIASNTIYIYKDIGYIKHCKTIYLYETCSMETLWNYLIISYWQFLNSYHENLQKGQVSVAQEHHNALVGWVPSARLAELGRTPFFGPCEKRVVKGSSKSRRTVQIGKHNSSFLIETWKSWEVERCLTKNYGCSRCCLTEKNFGKCRHFEFKHWCNI